MMEDWELGYNWLKGLQLLSLDFLRPVYSSLGTGILREETLRGLARDALLWRLDSGCHPEPQSAPGMAAFYRYQVGALLQIAEPALGESAERALTHWIQFVQCQEDSNPWVRYQDAMLSWASHFRKTGIDSIGFSQDAAEIEKRLRQNVKAEEVRKILEQQSTRFLAEWDFPLFKDQGLLDVRDNSPFFPFVDSAVLVVEMHRFQLFWIGLIASVNNGEVRAIDAFVRGRKDEVSVAAWELPTR
jgi:hypothetical protein